LRFNKLLKLHQREGRISSNLRAITKLEIGFLSSDWLNSNPISISSLIRALSLYQSRDRD